LIYFQKTKIEVALTNLASEEKNLIFQTNRTSTEPETNF